MELEANKSYIIDLILWTKNFQSKLVCTRQICSTCEEVQKKIFIKAKSFIQLILDKPDPTDNTKILYNQKEIIPISN